MKLISSLIIMFSVCSAMAATSKVRFIKPHEGEIVKSPFAVEYSVAGMKVAKAGEMKPGTGHHHLIIDGKSIPKGEVVPTDETHKHFGDATSSTMLSLPPGKHTLTLQFADGKHKSLGEEYSTTINIEVQK